MAKRRKRKKGNKFGAETRKEKLTWKGITYRSLLEVFCAKSLLSNKLKFSYESDTYTLMEGFVWEGTSLEKYGRKFKQVNACRPIRYTPDFIGSNWIIETKGMRTASFNMKWKMFKKHLIDNNIEYHLFAPSNQKEVLETIDAIKNLKNG